MTLKQLRSLSLREAFGELLDISPRGDSLAMDCHTPYQRDLRQHFDSVGSHLRSAIEAFDREHEAEIKRLCSLEECRY